MATVEELGERALRRLGVSAVAPADRPGAFPPRSQANIALDALRLLGVVAAEETPAAADQALAEAKVAAVQDNLVLQGLVPWPMEAVPLAVSEDYVRLVALHLGPVFGKAGDPAAEAPIEARIRRVALLMRAPDLATGKVMAVHAGLDATGRARWSSFEIPDYAEEVYVSMAAALLAPEFGIAPDPAAWAEGERAIARMVALPSSGAGVMPEWF